MKVCKKCGEEKDLTQFYSGRHTCKTCRCAQTKRYRVSVEYKRPKRSATKTDNSRRNLYTNQTKAQSDVAWAIKSGKLCRKPCEVCGNNDHVHAHHDDYLKTLDVRWLCPKHHSEWHLDNGDGINK